MGVEGEKSPFTRYAITIFVLGAATFLRFLLDPVLGPGVPFILFFPSVVICAWFGGLRHGLLSTFIGALIAWHVFIPLEFSATVQMRYALGQLFVFLFAGVLISILAESLHRSKSRAEQSEVAERHQGERFLVTLSSIGDAVIATDNQALVTFINPIAETLTGWKKDQAVGRPLQEVFVILNEKTREPVENPALKAIQEGRIFGLANHTILISKDGTEVPIDDSGAPIKDIQGHVNGAVLVFRDITQRRNAERAQAFLANIVEGSNDAVISKNLEGIILSWNQAAERMFGYSAEEAIGQTIRIIIPDDQTDEEDYILQRLRKGEIVEHFETVRRSKDAKLVDVSVTISPIRDRSGNIIAASKIVRDITEHKRIQRERITLLEREQEARAEAEAANLAKDIFLATVTHELRSPLNAISGWVDLLESGTLNSATAATGLKTIRQSIKVQSRLVDDLLDVSHILSGKLALERELVDLLQIIDAAVEGIRPALRDKSIEIDLQLDPATPKVPGDAARLQQVIANLVNNSVKFTPSGGRISIWLQQAGTTVQLKVSDSGKGIDKDFLPYLFEKFRQGKDARKYGGLGLGLSIVRHLVEMHGGTVTAESPGENLGATFVVILPAQHAVRSASI